MSFFNAAQQALNSSISNNRSYGNSQDDENSQGDRQTGGQDYNNGQQQQNRQSSNNDGYSQDVRQTGGQQYNSPNNGQQPQGRYNTDDVLSHANTNDEDNGYISNAIQHVHDNSEQHQDQVSPNDMSTYGPMITKALSSVASKHGVDVNSFLSGSVGGQGGGNQLMGMVMKEAGNYASSSGGGDQDKQSVMNGAAMTLTKLAAQGQLSSFTGGLGGIANMGKSLLQNFGQ